MNNTPDSPAQTPDDRMNQGGNYWTLFTPGIWKLLHAVSQSVRGLDLQWAVIGWKDTRETRGAVWDALPLLRTASKVTIAEFVIAEDVIDTRRKFGEVVE